MVRTWTSAKIHAEKRVRLTVTPRKMRVGLKRRRGLSKRKMGWRLAWLGFTEKEEKA